jgi:PilZ domain
MSNVQLVRDQSICTRKERRFKTCDENLLRCELALESGGVRRGSVLDLSASGLRMVCEGSFTVGTAFTVDLTSDRSYGMFCGVVRRVDPWVGGRSVIGCSLSDRIRDQVLEDLANLGVVDRRSDHRVPVTRKAKISWQLQPGEIDAELQDCSSGGLKLLASAPVPLNSRLRIRFEDEQGDDGWITVEGNSVWQRECEAGVYVGIAFTQKDTPNLISHLLDRGVAPVLSKAAERDRVMGPISYAACAVIALYTLLVSI